MRHLWVLILLPFAGCVDEPAPMEEPVEEKEPTLEQMSESGRLYWQVGFTPVDDAEFTFGGVRQWSFRVSKESINLTVGASWSCGQVCPLEIEVRHGDGEIFERELADESVEFHYETPKPGTWYVKARSREPTMDMEGHAFMTVQRPSFWDMHS